MAAPLRVALLGCGTLAEILANVVYPAASEDLRVVAAVDVRSERADRLAGLLQARAYPSLAAACGGEEVEAVDIRLPHHLHLEGARLAGDAGLPFLIEKPLAPTLADALAIADLAAELGPSCGVSENYGFLAPVRAAAELLADGAIGDLLAVQSTRVFELGPEWRRDGWRLGGDSDAQGVLVDQATHVARMLRTVVGELVEVHAYASAGRGGWAGPDSASVAYRLASGITGTQTYCWGSPAPPPGEVPELSLYGSAGSIAVHVCYAGRGGGAALRRPDRDVEWHATQTNYYDSLRDVLVDWARAVRKEMAPAATLQEGIRDVAVLEAIRRSARCAAPAAVTLAP